MLCVERKSLQTIYISFIGPLLKYADIVWNNYSQYETIELEPIQNEAASILKDATIFMSINALLGNSLIVTKKAQSDTFFYK